MKTSAFTALALIALATGDPVVKDCNNVTYLGYHKDGVETFTGIRFGQDTGGENRFKPPREYVPAAWSTIRATAEGPACPQATGAASFDIPFTLNIVNNISEDCLRLNVARPNGTTASSKLPVMVYIYGGSFISGFKDDTTIQPGGMILESIANGHPIMHVAMNYRLGVFGFAKSDALEQEGSENAGVRDQRLALEWVQRHISAFGGDPDRVTIHGQSSGGLAVGIQILAYGGSKPAVFEQAICQSQALEPNITGAVTAMAYRGVVDTSGCSSTDLQSNATVTCLRGLSMDDLLQAQLDSANDSEDQWLPAVDNDFLPAAPSELIQSGRFYNVSAMMGWCDNDAVPFVDPDATSTANGTYEFVRQYLPGFTEDNINKVLDLYPSSEFHSSYFPNGTIELAAETYRSARIERDILFVCQDVFLAQALNNAGNDIYFYDHNQTILTPFWHTYGLYGWRVVHTSEFAYVFGNLSHYNVTGYPYHPTSADYSLKQRESRSWTSFAAVGRPSLNGKQTIQGWEKANFTDNNLGAYVIGGPYEGYSSADGSSAARNVLKAERLKERCDFFNQPEIIRQQLY